jgi:hypothetical protein
VVSSAWLERYVDIVEVIGSNPIPPTIFYLILYNLVVLLPAYLYGKLPAIYMA